MWNRFAGGGVCKRVIRIFCFLLQKLQPKGFRGEPVGNVVCLI